MSERSPLLIVEDDPALLTQMTWAFEQYRPVPAADREAALNQLRRHRAAVVTMDLGLPPHADEPTEGFRLLQIVVLAQTLRVRLEFGRLSVVKSEPEAAADEAEA